MRCLCPGYPEAQWQMIFLVSAGQDYMRGVRFFLLLLCNRPNHSCGSVAWVVLWPILMLIAMVFVVIGPLAVLLHLLVDLFVAICWILSLGWCCRAGPVPPQWRWRHVHFTGRKITQRNNDGADHVVWEQLDSFSAWHSCCQQCSGSGHADLAERGLASQPALVRMEEEGRPNSSIYIHPKPSGSGEEGMPQVPGGPG